MNGFTALRAMRAEGWNMPVLLLTARSTEADKVQGFRLGADDYVTKPFGVQELVSRIIALLRRVEHPRTTPAPSAGAFRFSDVEIDMASRIVRQRGRELSLTPRAFDLLVALVRRRGEIVRREDLMRELWAYSTDVSSRTLDAHIAELRRKLHGQSVDSRYIKTVWKVGYRLVG